MSGTDVSSLGQYEAPDEVQILALLTSMRLLMYRF
jgi:hypothetical protein